MELKRITEVQSNMFAREYKNRSIYNSFTEMLKIIRAQE